MSALLSPFLVVAGVLAIAGVGKLRHPGAARDALERAGFGVPAWAIRAAGAAELALAVACIARPSAPTAALLALVYAGFAALVARLLRRSPGAPCGCFGEASRAVTRWHLALNLAAAAVAAAAALAPPAWSALEGPVIVAVFAAATLASVYLAYLAYTALPEAWSAYEGGRGGTR
jgi:hypothetical protein